jgi:hypothetical protein
MIFQQLKGPINLLTTKKGSGMNFLYKIQSYHLFFLFFLFWFFIFQFSHLLKKESFGY